MLDKKEQALEYAQDLIEEGEVDKALRLLRPMLRDNPNDPGALCAMTAIYSKADEHAIAYHLGKRLTEIAPKNSSGWINFGMAANDLWREGEAEIAFENGLKVAADDRSRIMLYLNMCAMYTDTGNWEKGKEYAQKALDLDPTHVKAKANLGFAQLALHEWEEGWKNYHECLGGDFRKQVQYGEEPEWEGEPGKHLAIYGEQGLGDEICGASVLQEVIDISSKVVLDIDSRLEGLFQRSFPEARVYGTRREKAPIWAKDDVKPEASMAIVQLGEFFRNSDDDFPGEPYLIPDTDRVLMWKALFESKNKPVIGIAWRGGIQKTGAKFRQWDLDDLLPIFKSVDAHWVSLQYKPAAREIHNFKKKHPEIDLVEYPHGTLTDDYDDTAALVAALDHTVCMQTAVAHLCGAMGKSCWVFVPKNSQWRYGGNGDSIPWYKTLRVIRQKERGKWKQEIRRTAGELKQRFTQLKVANVN